MEKPDGLVVIRPERVAEVLATLPVRRIPGVGRVTAEALKRFGIEVAGDLLRHDIQQLEAWFGGAGIALRDLAEGIDDRPVRVDRGRKQVSVEDTFPQDLLGVAPAEAQLRRLAETLAQRLGAKGLRGYTLTLKVTYADFTRVSRRRTLGLPISTPEAIYETSSALLAHTEVASRPIRLLGIGVSKLEGEARQLLLPFFESAS
jgi:DNA polymerase-4